MKRFVFKKPSNRTQSNRTRNQSNTRRNQSNRRTRSNRRRGSNRTATQSSRNVTEVANRQRQIRQHLNNRFRNPKKAVLLITTHGNLDDTDERVQHALDINVHKLNATTPGVCNWIADEDLVGMGLKINEIVKENKDMSASRLLHKLKNVLPTIDEMYKEDTKMDNEGKVQESDYFETNFKDQDFTSYYNNKGYAYETRQWKKGDIYLNKYYTSFIDEEYDTNSNPFNNNVILLGTKGLLELDLMNKSRTSLRKDKDIIKKDKKANKKRFFLKDILEELEKDGYTDVVIIDLSCSTGFGETAARYLRRTNKKEGYIYGGNKKN